MDINELDKAVAEIVGFSTIYENHYDGLPYKKDSGDWFLQVADKLGLEGKGGLITYSPSTNWSQGGPLIEEYEIWLTCDVRGIWWATKIAGSSKHGETPLIAAMKAIVAKC